MRPVRLEMKGFSTFRDQTVIDFVDIELLALIGPTGSGKSSVIDAMTFALYGSAARYDERAVAPVINQLSTEARVLFTFEVAGEMYTATRVVRRTKAGATTKEARLERGEAVLAGDPKGLTDAVTKLLGLDFQRFNKTVVLPQGRFAEFLHDKPSDRQELLRELFGYGMYEQLGRQAREIANTKRNEAAVREQGLADLGDLSDERLADAEAAVSAVAHARSKLSEMGDQLTSAERRLTDIDRKIDEVVNRLELLSDVVVPDGVADLSAQVAVAAEAEREAAAARELAREQLQTARDAVASGPDPMECQELLAAYERHRALEARAVDAAVKVAAAHARVVESGAAADEARAAIAEARQHLSEARARRDQAADVLAAGGDRAQLAAALAAYERADAIEQELQTQSISKTQATARAATARATFEAAQAELAQLERLAPAAALAAHLHVGEACPVCAQDVVQLPQVQEVDVAALATARERASTSQDEFSDADRVVHQVSAQISALENERAKVLASARAWPDRPALTAQLERIAELAEEAAAARQLAVAAEVTLAELEEHPERRAALAAEQSAATDLAAQQALEAQAQADLTDSTQQLNDRPAEVVVRADADTAKTLATEAIEAQRAEELAEQHHASHVTRRQEAEANERDARHDFDVARERVAMLKPPKPAGTLAADWDALCGWCGEQEAAQRTLAEQLNQQRSEAVAARTATLHVIEDLVEGFVDDPTVPFGELLAELIGAEADAKNTVKHLKAAHTQQAKVIAQVEALRSDAEVAELLGKLLKTDRFQRWLLEEAMNDLVERATVRLRELTANQYSLVADDGAFKIVDHRNADEVRDARSLSGGETFLTSLSLALALADSTMDLAAEGAAPMESIFLDEGFGTLDPDTLEVVAGTIEELGASGRMVGIVTHIRDLADRMPTRLEISKGPNGSTVERVDV